MDTDKNLLQDRLKDVGELLGKIAGVSSSQTATSPDSPNWPTLLSNLGSELIAHYESTGNLADLEAAVDAFQQAVQATSPDSPNWPALLSNLGSGLSARYKSTGNLVDLEAAIDAFQQAVQATPTSSPARSTLLNNLGNGLRARYERTGEQADQNAAISTFEQAIRSTEGAKIESTKASYSSPFSIDWKVDIGASSLAEALMATIDGIAQSRGRLEKAKLDYQAKEKAVEETEQRTEKGNQMVLLEQEKQRLELEQSRLDVLEQQLELQKRGIEYALEIAAKVVDTLQPNADPAIRAIAIQALLPDLLQLQKAGRFVSAPLIQPQKAE